MRLFAFVCVRAFAHTHSVAIMSDAKHELREGGKVLVVTATSLSQSGSYSCMASHSELDTPTTGSTNITVECKEGGGRGEGREE